MTDPTALAAAYEQCRRIQARHGQSFYRATGLLPPSRRRHVWALYALARTTDDLVDDPARADAAEAFATWRDRATHALAAVSPPHPLADPILTAAWHTVHELDLPLTSLNEFFDSMALDLQVRSYHTFADLRGYMRGSAAVVGELMAALLGAPRTAWGYAGLLGEAFQLTNFIRDIAEDLTLGRVYLPLDDLAAFGVSADELRECAGSGRTTGPVRLLLTFEIGRARELYAAAWPGVALLPRASRPCVRAAIALYAEILADIERASLDVFAGRVVVPRHRRAACVARALSPLPGPPLWSR